MSRVLYFDCFSGISGDMVLGALLDAGLPLDELKRALGSLAARPRVCDVHARRACCAPASSATKFNVARAPRTTTPFAASRTTHDHGRARCTTTTTHPHDRTAPASSTIHPPSQPCRDLRADRSDRRCRRRDATRAKALFQRLGEAEAAIHQMPVEQVHLHEVGALDSIIDIVGAVFALEWLGADRIVCSPLNVGGGMVQSAHGLFPVPAPATVRLLGDAPIYSGAVQKELVTPTGALIVTAYADDVRPDAGDAVERVGYGAGDRDNPGHAERAARLDRPARPSGRRAIASSSSSARSTT